MIFRFAFALAALAAPAAAAMPTIVSFADDATFVAVENAATYQNRGNASILWGGTQQQSFEYAIRAANDVVVGAPGQVDWANGAHSLGQSTASLPAAPFLRYTAGGQVDLSFRVDEVGNSPGGDPTGNYVISRTLPIAGVNTLFVRGKTPSAQSTAVATLRGIIVRYGSGRVVDLGTLVGDFNGQYIGFTDAALAGGFTVEIAGGSFDYGNGVGIATAAPALQLKFGTVVIETPAPAAAALFGLGLAAIGLRRRIG